MRWWAGACAQQLLKIKGKFILTSDRMIANGTTNNETTGLYYQVKKAAGGHLKCSHPLLLRILTPRIIQLQHLATSYLKCTHKGGNRSKCRAWHWVHWVCLQWSVTPPFFFIDHDGHFFKYWFSPFNMNSKRQLGKSWSLPYCIIGKY